MTDLVEILLEQGAHALEVVEGRDQRVGVRLRRDAVAPADDLRPALVPRQTQGRLVRHQDGVVRPVISPLELDQLGAPGVAAGQADGVHRRLGPRVREAPLVLAEPLAQLARHRDLEAVRHGVQRAALRLRLDRLHDPGMRVPHEHRAKGVGEVGVAVAVRIGDGRADGRFDEDRVRIDHPEIRGDAPRQESLRLGVQLAGFLRALDVAVDDRVVRGRHAGSSGPPGPGPPAQGTRHGRAGPAGGSPGETRPTTSAAEEPSLAEKGKTRKRLRRSAPPRLDHGPGLPGSVAGRYSPGGGTERPDDRGSA